MRTSGTTCNGKAMPAVAPVSWNAQLADAAARHSRDMASNGFLSHTGSDGSRAGARIGAAGFTGQWTGENIAAGYSSINAVIAGWLSSTAGHCEGIMNPRATYIGASAYTNPGTQYRVYWTLVLGR